VFSNQPTETSGVNSGIFCYRNFRSAKKHEVSNEVSVERKPEKFSMFQVKMNYCVQNPPSKGKILEFGKTNFTIGHKAHLTEFLVFILGSRNQIKILNLDNLRVPPIQIPPKKGKNLDYC
jgi:hypothetical protein